MTLVESAPAPVVTEPGPADLCHGAHYPCQREAEYIIAACGYLLDPSERADPDDEPLPDCRPCLEAKTCPVCGERLFGPIVRPT